MPSDESTTASAPSYSYLQWIRRFTHFAGDKQPTETGPREVTAFLNHLATERHVAAATQNQALAALLFMYKEALGRELPWLDDMARAKRPVRNGQCVFQLYSPPRK